MGRWMGWRWEENHLRPSRVAKGKPGEPPPQGAVPVAPGALYRVAL